MLKGAKAAGPGRGQVKQAGPGRGKGIRSRSPLSVSLSTQVTRDGHSVPRRGRMQLTNAYGYIPRARPWGIRETFQHSLLAFIDQLRRQPRSAPGSRFSHSQPSFAVEVLTVGRGKYAYKM